MCKNLGFTCETEYFGLVECSKNASSFQCDNDGAIQSRGTKWSTQYYNWINLRNPLGQHGTTGQPYSLDFRVKFWVPPHLIIQENVRNIFYMQAKSDLLNGRLRATDWQCSAELGALLAHADQVIFDSNALKCEHSEPQLANPHQSNDSTAKSNSDDDENGCSSNAPRSDTFGCIPIDGIKNLKHSTHNRKKRKFSMHRVILNANCDNDEDDHNDDSEANDGDDADRMQWKSQTISPLHVYNDYVIHVENVTEEVPSNHLNEIVKQHSKLAKSTPKSAKYVLLQSVFRLAGLGEEAFSGICFVASATAQQTTTVARHRLGGDANDWSEHMRLRITSNCHENDSTQRCDIAVGPHGILINTADEQTRFV